jgi:hypothetical protein
LLVLGVVVVLSVAELTSERFNAFTRDHSLISTFLTEAVLLVGVYLVLDEIIERRETRRWGEVMSLGIRALSTRAEEPAEVVRGAVDELAVEAEGERPGLPPDASDDRLAYYQEFVSARANELGDWLRADDLRAPSFARETRQSASRLEEAIIRWCPTLVEDPESAELINLLPDIVDSARAAADLIAPAAPRFDRTRREDAPLGTRAWTDADRKVFEDSLLEILRNADEFRRRVSPRAPS